ncbi:hypothetical protein FHS43_006251 [Streptosporangium becharense]|uniref:Uncharacterized protein n=1 Tax=Streptosporangium becharense TaxID=1816182 RepID=A0A7W9IH10_9ACTN|nr:hypothetical protein [Streptosporangium becharense]MBB2914939.1 hypothetical protein [Streptosporangium becharense]MBB5820250.1 hypothetical protein [Streptosporangium becharense]
MAVGVVIGAVVTVPMVLDPPSSPPSTSSSTGVAHSETEVRQAAQPALDAYAEGAYGDFWDLWTPEAQELISRGEYMRLFIVCPPPGAVTPFAITEVTVTGDDATVRATRLGDSTDFAFRYDDGTWRYVLPEDEELEYETRTVDEIAERRRSAGSCGVAPPASGGPDPAQPGAGTQAPGTGTQAPGTATQAPGPGVDTGTGMQTPGTGTQGPGTGMQTPGMGTQGPGTGTQGPGTGIFDVGPDTGAFTADLNTGISASYKDSPQ